VEASGPAIVPAYEPSIHSDRERPYPVPEPDPSDKRAEKLWLLWKARRFLFGVLWKSALLATIAAFLIPKHYESVVRIVPAESSTSGGSSSMMGLLSKAMGGGDGSSGLGMGLDAASLLGAKTPAAFYVEVLKSRTVQDRLINSFDLRARYRKLTYYEARKKLTKFTDIEQDSKSGVITLKVTDYEPKVAAQIANAYIQELNRLAVDLNTSSAHREREFLEERLKTAKQDLSRASLDLSQFTSRNSMVDPQNEGKAMMDAASRLQGELIAHETELKGLQEIYSNDNVRVRTLNARIAELRVQLKKIVGSSVVAGKDASTPDASGPNSGLYPSMRTLPTLGSRYADLYREAKIQEAVYAFVTQQYELAKIQEAKEVPIVRVMDAGEVPEKKSSPIRSLIVGLSVLSALTLACFWVIGKHHWEHVSANDPYRLLAAEISAEVRAVAGKFRGPAS